MVEGLNKFKETLGTYSENYVIIGGTACNVVLEEAGAEPRVTHDIDLIVVVEHLTKEFVAKFWTFIRDGGYSVEKRKRENEEPVYALYRFSEPKEIGYPIQIELLARHSDTIGDPADVHIEPILPDDYHYSLSAIVLDDDLYYYVIQHSVIIGGLKVASLESLICLKARAYLNLLQEKREGKHVNSDDIRKHRRDVMLLVAARAETESIKVPESIHQTIKGFIHVVSTDETKSALCNSLHINNDLLTIYLTSLGEMFEGEQS